MRRWTIYDERDVILFIVFLRIDWVKILKNYSFFDNNFRIATSCKDYILKNVDEWWNNDICSLYIWTMYRNKLVVTDANVLILKFLFLCISSVFFYDSIDFMHFYMMKTKFFGQLVRIKMKNRKKLNFPFLTVKSLSITCLSP